MLRLLPWLVLSSLLLPACGDDAGTDSGLPDGGPPDGAGPDASGTDGGTDGGGTDGGGMDGGGTDGGGTDGGGIDAPRADGAGIDGFVRDGGVPTVPTMMVFRDFRRCISPLCGGFWLQVVNLPAMACRDGEVASTCYVPEIDWSALGLSTDRALEVEASAGRLLVEGTIVARDYPTFGDLGELVARDAWMAEWGVPEIMPSSASYHHVIDTGLACLVDPCFSFELTLLNVGSVSTVSTLDLSGAGAPPEAVTAAEVAARADDLQVAGTIVDDAEPGPGGLGRTVRASQFFLPVEP